jgi:hypothetical protein
VKSLADGHVDACLDDLERAGEAPRAFTAAGRRGGWSGVLVLIPTPAEEADPGLSRCQLDCLTVLGLARDNWPATRVRKELEDRGFEIYGLSTIQRALIDLHKRGLVCNSRKKTRGYWLAHSPPLFRKPAQP